MARSITAQLDSNALYLVDSSIYIFRAWQMQHATHDANGNPSTAVVGFTDFLYQLIKRRQPTRLVCAFDESHGTSLRHAIYPGYKSNRPPAPNELKRQFALCKAFTTAAGVTSLGSITVEADDIIGTLAMAARATGSSTVIVSADKDLCQFVGPQDAIWNFARNIWMDERLIEKRFGVKPIQIPDLLALTGDKTDNIPGVPGIGIATAAKLLRKWGSLDLLLDNLSQVSSMKFHGAKYVATQLESHSDVIRLARRLTGLQHYATPCSQSFKIKPDFNQLDRMFDLLQFDALKREQWQQLLR